MVNQETPLHKLIVVEDIGRDLNPIGYGFKSPILTPFKAPIDIVRRLLGESMVTNMHEVYEKDPTLRVKLTVHNFRQSFEEIWKEQNPGSLFPWEVGVTDIPTSVSQTEDPQSSSEPTDNEVDPAPTTVYDDEEFQPIVTAPVEDIVDSEVPALTDSGEAEEQSEENVDVTGVEEQQAEEVVDEQSTVTEVVTEVRTPKTFRNRR